MAVNWMCEDMQRATVSEVDELINIYLNYGGTADTLKEGVLGHGLLALQAYGLPAAVVQERYLNCWCSVHRVHFYKELPLEYVTMLEEVLENE